jgi:hypothetical protein
MSFTLSDIENRIAKLARIDTTDVNAKAYLDGIINDSQDEINAQSNWWWLNGRYTFQTVIDKVAGTISINAGDTTVTGIGTSFAATDVGSFIQFTTSNDWYRVASYVSPTQITLEVPYVGATALTGGTYIIRKLYYPVSADVDTILDIKQYVSPRKLVEVSYRDTDEYQPDMVHTGEPTSYYRWFDPITNLLSVAFYPIPSSVMNMDVRYVKKSVPLVLPGDTPLIPERWARTALVAKASASMLSYNRDALAPQYYQLAAYYMDKMQSVENNSPDKHSIVQNRDYGRKSLRIPLPSNFPDMG